MTTLQRGEEALLCRVKAVDWARLKFCFAATALCMLLAARLCVVQPVPQP